MWLLFGIVALSTPPGILAQTLDTGTSAASVGDALRNAKQQRIVVFDFLNSDESLSQLGRSFADEFSRLLAESNPKFQVVDRRIILQLLEEYRLAPAIVHNSEVASWLATRLSSDSFVVGRVDSKGVSLQVALKAIRVKDGKKIADFAETLPLSDFAKSLAATWLSLDHSEEYPPKGDKSLLPKCISCPNPFFPAEALHSDPNGSLKLSVRIGEDGLPSEINVITNPPPGFVLTAIEKVQKWTFKPLIGADGKPKGTWTPIEITWRSY